MELVKILNILCAEKTVSGNEKNLISTITKMKADGKKSFHFVKDTDIFSPYKVYEIPSTLKRVFLDSDYTILTTLQEGE